MFLSEIQQDLQERVVCSPDVGHPVDCGIFEVALDPLLKLFHQGFSRNSLHVQCRTLTPSLILERTLAKCLKWVFADTLYIYELLFAQLYVSLLIHS